MAICYSCRNIRLGETGGGDTLIEALNATNNVIQMGIPAAGYEMLKGIINSAEKRGVCSSCISDLYTLKREVEKVL